MLKKISIAIAVLIFIGIASLYYFNPIKKASGKEEKLTYSAAQEFSKKLTELASVSNNQSPKTLEFTEKEINSYLQYDLSHFFPEGLHEVRIKLLDNSLVANARVNFDEMQAAENSKKNPLLSTLLRGEHSLEATGKVRTQNKVGSYEILTLQLDQTEIPKPIIDLLITKFVLPKYPEAKPNTNFDLPYGIDKIDLNPGKLVIHQGEAGIQEESKSNSP